MAMRRAVSGAAVSWALLSAAPGVVAEECTPREPTREASIGPHDFSTAPAERELWREGDAGEPLVLSLRVLDTCARPLAGARVQLLHANQDGEHERGRWRAILNTDERGELELVTVLPGYAGGLPRHIHFIVSHPEHDELVTRMFFKSDPAFDKEVEDLAVVPEEVRRGEKKRWVAGFEFILRPR